MARTTDFKTELAEKSGGMLVQTDVAELLGVTPEVVDEQRQRGQILGISYGSEIRFPAAQFSDGAVVPGLKAILTAFGDMNPWGQLQLLLAPLTGFRKEPASILDMLSQGIDQDVQKQFVGLVRGWAR